MERSKRRTRSQCIGAIGETIAQEWMLDVHLVPNKVGYDYGLDFLCQIMRPLSSGQEEATGQMIAVQVRTVSGQSRKRIRMDRVDAETAIRVQMPFCLLAVEVSTRQVHFRLMDFDFLAELSEFVHSDRQSITFRIGDLHRDSNVFRSELQVVARPSYQQRLRLLKASLDIQSIVPEGRIEMYFSEKGEVTLVSVPWVTSLFRVEAGVQSDVADIFFKQGKLPPPGSSDFRLRPEVEQVSNLVNGPIYFFGKLEAESEMIVDGPSGRQSCTVAHRKIGDEHADIFPSGLILSTSERRWVDRSWVHQLRHSITDENVVSLGNVRSGKSFLRELRAGRRIGHDMNSMLQVETWGALQYLGPDVEALEEACSVLGVSLEEVYLKDLENEECLGCVDVIRALQSGIAIGRLVPGFVLGPGAEQEYSDQYWRAAGYRMPIVANFKTQGVVVWVEGEGEAYVCADVICGFRPKTTKGWVVEVRQGRFLKSLMPEVWLSTDWPPIPLFSRPEAVPRSFVGGNKLECGGDVWLIP
jgi:hypothetical protein